MEDASVPAGPFGPWLLETMAAARQGTGVDVPCGECTACCTSSQFVHVEPDEAAALAAIPSALLFPAPGLADGHVLMGYDAQGRCPMFVDGACSIYDDRPRTCRAYDCRVLTAAGEVPGSDKPAITERVVRWRFSADDDDARAREAIRSAASFLRLRDRAGELGEGAPATATQRAFVAVMVHEAFLEGEPTVAEVAALLRRRG